MNATESLHGLGQSLWLDNITRTLLVSGTLARYIQDLSVTGLTSNPTIFEHAIGASDSYDAGIRVLATAGLSDEDIFFELALEDLTEAADLFRPTFEVSDGVDGWVSLEVSPLLADNTAHTIHAARRPPRRTCSSRSREHLRESRRSSRSSSMACLSTSRCCSRASRCWRPPTRIFAALNAD